MTYKVTGVTRNNSGVVLGSCECFLFKYNSGTGVFTQTGSAVTSNATTGAFAFTGLADNASAYQVVFYKNGSPNVFDVTDRNLTPVIEPAGGGDPPAIFGANLLAWYKADVGLLNMATAAPTSGDAIKTWADQSGNGLTLTAPGLLGPIYQATGISGHAGCVFSNTSGGDTHMQTAANAVSLGGQALSVFVVCQMASTCQNNGRLFCFLGSADSADAAASTSVAALLRNGTGNGVLSFRNLTSMASQAISTGTTVHVGMVFDGASTKVSPYLNGVKGTDYTGTDANDTFATTGTFGLSAQYTTGSAGGPVTSLGWDGPVAEIVVVKAAVTPTDAASLEAYFVGRGF